MAALANIRLLIVDYLITIPSCKNRKLFNRLKIKSKRKFLNLDLDKKSDINFKDIIYFSLIYEMKKVKIFMKKNICNLKEIKFY